MTAQQKPAEELGFVARVVEACTMHEDYERCRAATFCKAFGLGVVDTANPEVVHVKMPWENKEQPLRIRDAVPDGSVPVIEGCTRPKRERFAFNKLLIMLEEKGATLKDYKRHLFTKKAASVAKLEKAKADAAEDNRIRDWNRGLPLPQVADDVLARVLKAQAKDPRLFTMGDRRVRIAQDPETGLLRTQEITPAVMTHEIGRVVTFCMSGTPKDPRHKQIATPPEIVSEIMSRPDSPFPVLRGVADSPFFDAQGYLVTTPGYHKASRIYFMPPTGFRLPKVPERPTQRDVWRAKRILDEALWDIPFDGYTRPEAEKHVRPIADWNSASKANWLAKLIQPRVRQIINGACPWYAGQKPKARTGQTLLAHLHSLIAYGYRAQIQNQKKDADEYQKTVVAELRAGTRHLFFDNLHNKLDDPVLASLATGHTYKGRLLCTNDMVIAPINCELEFNGNNVQLSDELRERSVLIEINAKVEHPGNREGWRYPRLLDTVEKARPLFLWAVLVLVQAWVAAGSPQWQGKPMGGFEAACGVLGGVLAHAGATGFLGNRKALRDSLGDDGGEEKAFVEAWWKRFAGAHVNVGTLPPSAHTEDYTGQWRTKSVETLCDLLMANAGTIRLEKVSGKSPGTWATNLGRAVGGLKDQTYYLPGVGTVEVKRHAPKGSTAGWCLERV